MSALRNGPEAERLPLIPFHGDGHVTLPVWPHPEREPLLRYLLAIEPQRILSCLGVDEPGPSQEELLDVTMTRMREVSCGMRLIAAAARFQFRPEQWQEHVNNPPTPREPPSNTSSDSSAFAEEVESVVSTDTGGSQFSLRGVKISVEGARVDAINETRLSSDEVVPVGPHLQEHLPKPVFNVSPSSPIAEGCRSGKGSETGSTWGKCLRYEPVPCSGGPVLIGLEGGNAHGSDSYTLGAFVDGAKSPPQMAMMKSLVEDSSESLAVGEEVSSASCRADRSIHFSTTVPVVEEDLQNGRMWWRNFGACITACQSC